MSESLSEYHLALERLIRNQPIRLPKNTRITNDSVSLEAGRKKGSIKRSRLVYGSLIEDIEKAAANQKEEFAPDTRKIEILKESEKEYKRMYFEALARELSLVHEVFYLKKELERVRLAQSNTVTQLKIVKNK